VHAYGAPNLAAPLGLGMRLVRIGAANIFSIFLLAPPRASGLSDIWGSAFLPPFASRGKQGGDYCSSLSLTPCERPCWPHVVFNDGWRSPGASLSSPISPKGRGGYG